jgi:polysaccharide pyruvyl transferase WcaK-like protein
MLLWGSPAQQAEVWAALNDDPLWAPFLDDQIAALWRSRLFYSDTVSDYETLVRQKDAVLGYRLHGNLMALASAIPAVYFTYDSRTAEFCETFRSPHYDAYSARPFVLEEYWQQSAFEKFNRAYHARYRDMREFLEENAVAHRLAAPRHATPRHATPGQARRVA